MYARILAAVGLGLGMPIALFVGVLAVASEPQVVQELAVSRVESGDPARHLTRAQMSALPDAIRLAIETALQAGRGAVAVDEATMTAFSGVLGLTSGPRVVIEIGGALLLLEITAHVEPTRAEALAAWAGEGVESFAQLVRSMGR